tara:strand:+ start:7014 stop:8606 length:1593 start_codon:yes stop_codon:yes gene_type:complete
MGTYRQPSQVIDKSLSVANQGAQNIAAQMERGLRIQRQQQLQEAKQAQRQAELKNKDFKRFSENRNAAVDGYRESMASWEHINQGDAGAPTQGVSIENQLKSNALYYLDIMSGSVEGDERYRTAELSIKNMIAEYPLMADMLNKEAAQAANAYTVDGLKRNTNEPDAFLETDDPMSDIKKTMLRNVNEGSNYQRFNIQTGVNGVNIIYSDGNNKEFTLNSREYKTQFENGYNLVETTDAKAQKKFMDGVWDVVGKGYEGKGDITTTYTEFLDRGESVTNTEKVEHFEQANLRVKDQINKWVEENQGEVTQSQWQLLGGTGVYKRENNKGELAELLEKQQIANYGIPGTKLISDSSVEKRLPLSKLKKENEILTYPDIIKGASNLVNLTVSGDKEVADIDFSKSEIEFDPKKRKEFETTKLTPEFKNKQQEIKEKLRADLKAKFDIKDYGMGKVVSDFRIGIKDGEVIVYPQYRKENKETGDDELLDIPGFKDGIIINDTNLGRFDKLLGGAKGQVADSSKTKTKTKPTAY